MSIKVAAFGALNQDSYEMFADCLGHYAHEAGVDVDIVFAAPYPNAEAVSEPGRPLRGEALQDAGKKQELFEAVAADAMSIGAKEADICCMPCMSMIGFHEGVQTALARDIFRLDEALVKKYEAVDKIGMIHMRPAKKRVEEMFGAKAVTPDEIWAGKLLVAEEQAKQDKNSHAVEVVMAELVELWRDQGLTHVLLARADAPKAQKGPAGQVQGIIINSYFDILAAAVAAQCFNGPQKAF